MLGAAQLDTVRPRFKGTCLSPESVLSVVSHCLSCMFGSKLTQSQSFTCGVAASPATAPEAGC